MYSKERRQSAISITQNIYQPCHLHKTSISRVMYLKETRQSAISITQNIHQPCHKFKGKTPISHVTYAKHPSAMSCIQRKDTNQSFCLHKTSIRLVIYSKERRQLAMSFTYNIHQPCHVINGKTPTSHVTYTKHPSAVSYIQRKDAN